MWLKLPFAIYFSELKLAKHCGSTQLQMWNLPFSLLSVRIVHFGPIPVRSTQTAPAVSLWPGAVATAASHPEIVNETRVRAVNR